MVVLTDEQWAKLEPLLEEARPRGRTKPIDLRRSIEGVIWRHQNGARWRAVPFEFGPWHRVAQLFIRWGQLGAWGRLLGLAKERGVDLGMAFLDGTTIRAHHKAAGARKRGQAKLNGTGAKRSAARAAASAPKPASLQTGAAGPSRSG